MKKLAIATAALAASASTAFASQTCTTGPFGNNCTAVPEISALEGTAAIAVIAALVLLAWERRRRAA